MQIPMFKHFKMKLVKNFSKPQRRKADQGVGIVHLDSDTRMNSKQGTNLFLHPMRGVGCREDPVWHVTDVSLAWPRQRKDLVARQHCYLESFSRPESFSRNNCYLKNPLQEKSLQSNFLNIAIHSDSQFFNIAIHSDSLEDSRTFLKIFGRSKLFWYSLGNILDRQEDLQTVWKISRQSTRFSDSLEDFSIV